MTWSWRVFVLFLIVRNFKTVPLAWHVSLLNLIEAKEPANGLEF